MRVADGRRPSLVLAFAGMGVTASVVPAVLPSLAEDAGVPVSDYLDVVPGLFGGLFLGVLLSTLLARFWSAHVILTAGALLQFGGFALIAFAAAPEHVIGAGVIAGLGFGLAEASGSVLAKAVAAARTTSLLAALTGTVAAVAAICPIVLAVLLADGNARFLIVGASLVHLAGAALVAANRSAFGVPNAETPAAVAGAPARASAVLTLVGVGLCLFLYVGVETVFSGWSAVLAIDLLRLDAATAALGTSAFWALMALGRYVAWLVLKTNLAPATYLLINFGVATGALALSAVVASHGGLPSAVGVCITIVCLAPCYSLILGIGLSRMQLSDAARTTGFLVAAGAAGGSIIPMLILAASDEPAGQLVIAAAGCLMFVLFLGALAAAIWRPRDRTEAQSVVTRA